MTAPRLGPSSARFLGIAECYGLTTWEHIATRENTEMSETVNRSPAESPRLHSRFDAFVEQAWGAFVPSRSGLPYSASTMRA
jgi:hypothetical protein